MEDDYRTVNRASWDERVPAHAASPDYQLERFAADAIAECTAWATPDTRRDTGGPDRDVDGRRRAHRHRHHALTRILGGS